MGDPPPGSVAFPERTVRPRAPYAWRVGAPIEQLEQDATHARAVLESAVERVAEVATAAIAAWRSALVAYLENAASDAQLPAVRESIDLHLRNLPSPRVFESFAPATYAMYVTVRGVNQECLSAATAIEAAASSGAPNPDRVAERAAAILVALGWPITAEPSSIMGADFEDAASVASAARHSWECANRALQAAVEQSELKRRLHEKWRTGTSAQS